MISLAPKYLSLGSKNNGSSLNLIVFPAKSFVFLIDKNFSLVKAATTNSLLKFKISTFDLNL